MKVSVILHTIVSYILLFGVIIVLWFPAVILGLMPKSWRYSSPIFAGFLRVAYWCLLKCSLVPVHYEGLENIPSEPAIIAANHQSVLDVPLVGLTAKSYPHIWLAWSELFERPFHYFILSRIAIPLDVTSPLKAMRSLINVLDTIGAYRMHAIIFPEGSRFTDGRVHDFFAGFVIMAKKTGRPVVPVCIFNAHKVYPPHSLLVYWNPITVVVGKPMYMRTDESDDAFRDRVYEWFTKQTER